LVRLSHLPLPSSEDPAAKSAQNKSVVSLLRRLSTRRYPHLPLSDGACSTAPAAIARYLLPPGRLPANLPGAVAAVDRRDRQTDGHPPVTWTLHRMYMYSAGNVNKLQARVFRIFDIRHVFFYVVHSLRCYKIPRCSKIPPRIILIYTLRCAPCGGAVGA